jgi:hypothetical protein
MSFLRQEELAKRTAELMEQLRKIAQQEHKDQMAFARKYTEAQYEVILALLDENNNLAMMVAELYDKDVVSATGAVLPHKIPRDKLH